MQTYNKIARQRIKADPQKDAARKAKMREYNARYRKEHPDVIKNQFFRSHYGISLQDVIALDTAQNHCCALCGLPFGLGALKQFVDHDHVSGKVRGLLHSKCNTYLGVIENYTFRTLAEQYLERTKS